MTFYLFIYLSIYLFIAANERSERVATYSQGTHNTCAVHAFETFSFFGWTGFDPWPHLHNMERPGATIFSRALGTRDCDWMRKITTRTRRVTDYSTIDRRPIDLLRKRHMIFGREPRAWLCKRGSFVQVNF